MTDRALPRPEVWVQQDGMIPSGCAALVLEPGRIGGMAVAQNDLVIADAEIPHDRSVIIVRATML